MVEIRSLVSAAAKRLLARSILWWLTVCLTAAAGATLVLRVLDAFFAWEFAWSGALMVIGGASVVGAVVIAIVTRPKADAVAREVDERANLRESLSTAMCVERADDAWSQAVVQTAREKAVSVKLREVLPIQAPRYWFMPFAAAALVALMFWVLPEHFKWTKAAQAVEAKREFVKVEQQIKEDRKELEEALKKAGIDITDLSPELNKEGELGRPQSVEQLKRNEIKQRNQIQQELEKKLNSGEQSQMLRDMKRAMRQLQLPEQGPLAEMQKNLAKGDFGKAKEELKKLSEKLASEDMKSAEAQQLKKQLDQLSKQVEKLADQKQSLEQKLQNAGMSKEQAQQLASDPSQLQKALEQMQSMSQEQKEALMNAAKASDAAQQMMQQMSKSLQQASQCMNPGENGQQAGMSTEGMQAMSQMGEKLSSMEMSAEAMQQMKQALAMCNGDGDKSGEGSGKGNGQNKFGKSGEWKPGETNGTGSGTGGAGKGNGADPTDEEAAFETKTEKANVHKKSGPIIGQELIDGETFKGESRAKFFSQLPYVVESTEEAIENQLVPLEYQPAVRKYLDRLQKKAPGEPAKDSEKK